MKSIRIVCIILFSFFFTNSYAQSEDLVMKVWKVKKELKLTDESSVRLDKFKAKKTEILTEIKELESLYFSNLAQGKKDDKLRLNILNLHDKKHAIIAEIKNEALLNKDEALFLELLEHIRPNDLRGIMKQTNIKAEHRKVYTEWLKGIRETEVGVKLKNFSLRDKDGTEINTISLKGKIFWIDSWASKCGPCIKKLKYLKPIYKEYHSAGFEVLALSWDYTAKGYIKTLDAAKKDWLKLINKHDFNWLNVFDNADKVMAGQFGSVGKNLLIDANGTIIGFDLTPLEIERILENRL